MYTEMNTHVHVKNKIIRVTARDTTTEPAYHWTIPYQSVSLIVKYILHYLGL